MFSTVLWIFTDTRETVLRSFIDIARRLGLSNPTSTLSKSPVLDSHDSNEHSDTYGHVNAVLLWLAAEQDAKWLLVFDNFDDLESFALTEYLPKLPRGNIMITSRRQAAERYGEHMEIGVMKEKEATDLLLRCAGLSASSHSELLRHLVDVLGYLPLALDQAGAYIAEQGISIEAYLALFTVSRADLLKQKPPKAVWSYEETVFTTWEMSCRKCETLCPLTARLLDISAYFKSDDIPLQLVLDLTANSNGLTGIFLQNFIPVISSRSDYDQMLGRSRPTLLPQKLIYC